MHTMKLATLLLGAALFTGIGATSAMAMSDDAGESKAPVAKCGGGDKAMSKGMKCAAGKCGTAEKPMPKGMKCGAGKCGAQMKGAPEKAKSKCGAIK
jgi:uncharacterized low-complexity protein